MGRRSADDVRQIRRWRAIARHVTAIRKNCEPGDLECRRRQRQAVLHWAYRQPEDLRYVVPAFTLSYVVSAFRRTWSNWLNQAI